MKGSSKFNQVANAHFNDAMREVLEGVAQRQDPDELFAWDVGKSGIAARSGVVIDYSSALQAAARVLEYEVYGALQVEDFGEWARSAGISFPWSQLESPAFVVQAGCFIGADPEVKRIEGPSLFAHEHDKVHVEISLFIRRPDGTVYDVVQPMRVRPKTWSADYDDVFVQQLETRVLEHVGENIAAAIGVASPEWIEAARRQHEMWRIAGPQSEQLTKLLSVAAAFGYYTAKAEDTEYEPLAEKGVATSAKEAKLSAKGAESRKRKDLETLVMLEWERRPDASVTSVAQRVARDSDEQRTAMEVAWRLCPATSISYPKKGDREARTKRKTAARSEARRMKRRASDDQ